MAGAMDTNVILIVCDTLNKEVLQLYGGSAKTRSLNKLAKDAVVYRNAIAPSPWTVPTHVSILSGEYPRIHGVHEKKGVRYYDIFSYLKKQYKHIHNGTLLQEKLKKIGYNCICISNNPLISPYLGLQRGFNKFICLDPTANMKNLFDPANSADSNGASRIARNIQRTLQNRIDKGAKMTTEILSDMDLECGDLFILINLMEMHEPYKGTSPKKISRACLGYPMDKNQVNKIKCAYVKQAEYLDIQLGKIIDILRKKGRYSKDLLIITSDHGQLISEDFVGHGLYLNDAITSIPLIIKYPNNVKYNLRKGYQSIVFIKTLILDTLAGKDDSSLTKPIVFSECYGNHQIRINKMNTLTISRLRGKTKFRIYYDNLSLIYNATDSKIEYAYKGNKQIHKRLKLSEFNVMLNIIKKHYKL